MVEKLSMRPFSLSVIQYYFSVFIRRTIYICSRLCYRPLSLTEIFLLHDMKKENTFYAHNMASLESIYMIPRF